MAVRIGAMIIDLKMGLETLQKDLRTATALLQGQSKMMAGAFMGVKVAAGAVAAAVVGIAGSQAIAGIKDLVNHYNEAENTLVALKSALQSTSRLTDEGVRKIQAHAMEMQRLTKYEDDALIKASATIALFNKNLSTTELAEAQKAVVALANTLKIDLESATMLVAKSTAGYTGALGRYGINLKGASTESERLALLLEKTRGMMEGAEAAAGTLTGRHEQLKNAIGNLKESMGETLVKSFSGAEDGIKRLSDEIQKFDAFLKNNMKNITALVKAVTDLNYQWDRFGTELIKLTTPFSAAIQAFQDLFNKGINPQNLGFLGQMANGIKSLAGWFKAMADGLTKTNQEIRKFFDSMTEGVKKGLFGQSAPMLKPGGFRKASYEAVEEYPGYSLAGSTAPIQQAVTASSASFKGFQSTATDALEEIRGYGERLGSSLSSEIIGAVRTGKLEFDSLRDSFRNFAASAMMDLSSLILKMAVLEPLARSLSGALSGGGASSSGGGKSGFWGKLFSVGATLAGSLVGMPQLGMAAGSLGGSLLGGGGSSMGSVTSLASHIPGFAKGGWAAAGVPTLVGERGPELVSFGSRAYVTPNDQLGGGGSPSMNFYFTISAIDVKDFRERIAQEAPMIGRMAVSATQQAYNRRGQPGPMDSRRR